ncbi:SdrD B-like domain-containing protein [Paracoccus sp. IB05]|uniref:DUF7507 domain-containing protein n=1 Tax=Paracoccus sp. IB05 TaxID=2779367 RepID=UPI0018E6F5CB|nr:SdrD B-like domain-containing protein [Paracoccus sp. IB05]MBJ2151578.1 DUF11 domain-containing protein [Paracoccus sp. IB05]
MAFAFGAIIRTAFLVLGVSAGLARADLALNITDIGYDPVPAGGEISYTVRIANGGNLREPADTVTFSIPPQTVYLGTSGGLQNCSPAPEVTGPASVTCDVPSLAPRAAISGAVILRATTADILTFTGAINTAGLTVSETTTVTEGADLSLGLSGPVVVQAGAYATITATVTNLGPYSANGGQFQMSLPSGFSASGVVLPAGCSISGALITCVLPGPIPVNGVQSLDFTTQVITANDSSISVAGSVVPLSPPDPNLSNDSASTLIRINPGTDVALSKSRSPAGLVFAGDTVTFTLTPRHAGHAPLDAVITDTVPANYTVTGAFAAGSGWTCPAPAGNLVRCSYSSATPDPAGYNAPITITATANTATTAGSPVVNTASISSTTDVIPDNNQASDGGTDIAVPQTDLIARKSGPPHALMVVGNQYDWQIWTENDGNIPFLGRLIFTEHLPAGLRADAIVTPAGLGWSCDFTPPATGPRTIICQTDYYMTHPLPVGGRTQALAVRTTVLAEGNISNGLTVGFNGENYGDRDLSNNTVYTGGTAGEGPRIADLSLRKQVTSTGPYVSGDPVSFAIEIINSGSAGAEDVVLLDRLQDLYFATSTTTATTLDSIPAGMTCNVTRGAAFYSDLRCDMAALPVCTAGTDCPVLRLTVLAGDDGAKVNTAQTYSTSTPDPGYGNNEASAGYAITPRSDVTVEKTASHPDGASLPAGQPIIYTIAAIVPGTGLSQAENVQIVDSLPAGLRIISVTPGQGSCTPVTALSNGLTTAGSTVTCALGTILNGSRQSVTINAVPSTSVMNSRVTNRVVISTSTPEIDTTNNDDEISHNILPPSLDLVINKTDSKDPLELNDATVYTVSVSNTGPSESYAVVITDTLPGVGMRLDAIRSLTPGLSCTPQGGAAIGAAGGQILCAIDHLGVGARATFEVVMTGTIRGRWTNSARVTSAEAAYDPQVNNSATQTTSVFERAHLQVTKTASEATPDVLESFDWIVTVQNQPGIGIGLAEEVVLRDSLPANMIITGPPVPTAGSCDGQTGGRDIICILPDLAAGAGVTIRIPARATVVSANPQPFSNTAHVETISFDEASGHSGTANVNVLSTSVSGTVWRDFNENSARDLPQDAGVGSVTVTLTGRDLLNNPLTRTAVTTAGGAYSFTLLPPGTYDVSYTLPGGGLYTVGSALPSGAGGGTGGIGSRTITGITTTTAAPAISKDFTLIPVPQIALAKQVAAPALQPDGSYRLTYTLRLRNNSLEPVTGVQLRDILQPNFGTWVASAPQPSQYTVISATTSGSGVALTPNPGFTGQTETLLISSGTIPAQTTATVQLILHVNPPVPRPGSTLVLVNNASSAATGQWSNRALSDNSNNGATPQPGVQGPTSVTLTFTPAIRLTKTADITGLSNPPQPGEWIGYTFTATNSGNTPLLNVTVTDPMTDLEWLTNTSVPLLAPGASTAAGQFTARYQLKQSDIETGRISNTATTVGAWAQSQVAGGPLRTVSAASTANVTTLARPGLSVVKTRVSDTIQTPTRVGDTIRYSFVITNTGNVAIRNLVLRDVLTGIAPDPATSFTIGTLPPATVGANSVTVYANYTVTQNDIDAGVVVNTATAAGIYTAGGLPVSAASNEVRVPLHQQNLMRVTKLATTVPAVPVPGNSVTWTISIENLGNTRLRIGTIAEPLARTTVSAPELAVLDPGQRTTATATHTLDQAEIDSGEVRNQVTVAGTVPVSGSAFPNTPSGNDPVSPNTNPTLTPLPAHPSVALLKELITDTSAAMMPGDGISFRFTIRNTGNVTLDAITLTDDLAGVTLDAAALTGLRLAPGATVGVTGTYALLPADIEAGGLTNSARVDATDPHDTGVFDRSGTGFDNDTPTPVTLLRSPSVALVKTIATAPTAPVRAGDQIQYAFEIRNTGNVALRNVAISELVAGVTLSGSRALPLAVGATDSTSFTARYSLTQPDIDAGIFTNEARVTSVASGPAGTDVPVTAEAEADLAIAAAPGLTIFKTADVSGVQNPTVLNDEIIYSFTVTNTGNVTMTDVTVTDPLPGLNFTAGNVIARLAPGAAQAVTLSATYAVDQDDINLGRVDNQASVSGSYFDPAGGGTATLPPVSSGPVRVDLHQNAQIGLEKRVTSTLPVPVLATTPVTYGFTVTNTGNVTLTDVRVTEALAGATVSGGPVTLAPGASDSTSFTASYTLLQTDIEKGHLDNTAGVSGIRPGGGRVADSADNQLPLPQVPEIGLEKAANISGFADPAAPAEGDEIRYSFVIRNTGNVILTGITLTDAGLTFDAPIPAFTLAPGGVRVFADVGGHVLTQAEVNTGVYTNTASTSGNWGADGPVQDTIADDDTINTPLTPAPGIDLVKVIDLANSTLSVPPQAGDEVHYAFTVTNTGNVSLTGLTLTDPLTGILVTGSIAQLDPGLADSTSFSARYTLTQDDVNSGSVVNQATVTGTWGVDAGGVPQTVSDLSGTTIGTDGDTVLPITRTPSLSVVKSAAPDLQDPPRPDDLITYSFVVTNTGNVTLTGVQLDDPLPGLTFGPAGSLIARLEPGASQAVTLTATHPLTQQEIEAGQVVNTATAEGIFTDPVTGAVTDVDTVSNTITVPLRRLPELTVVKTATSAISTPAVPGEQVTYTITVTNSGNVLMTGVVVDDPLPRLTPGAFTIGDMAPGEVEVLTATYNIDQADIDAGEVVNQAIATGGFGGTPQVFPSGPDTSGPGVTMVPVPQEPGIALVKTADAAAVSDPAVVGQEIRYSFTIRNTGNVTLRDVSVADPLPGLQPGSLTAGVLAPGASITVGPAIYRITQSDITAGAVTNRALASGTWGPPGNPGSIDTSSVTDTGVDGPTVTPISGVPAIALVKALAPGLDPASLRLGSEVVWVFTVTNTGNVPLTGITVTETLAGATVSGGPVSLAPGASDTASFTARYSVTQPDLDAGFILNQAIVTGVFDTGTGTPQPVTDRSGTTIRDDDPTRTPLTQQGAIDLVKRADLSGLSAPPVAGDVIRYSFTVTNTGAVTLANVVVSDPMPGLVLTGTAIPSLAPGASNTVSFSASYTLTQADINSGSAIENQAEATGTYTDGAGNPQTVRDLSGTEAGTDGPTIVNPPRVSGLTLVKTADTSGISSSAQVGEVIVYSFTLTNTGNVTLSDVAVNDPLPGLHFSGNPVASLAPGASVVVTGRYALTEADIRAAERENTATASGIWVPVTGAPVAVPSGPSSVTVPLGYPLIGFSITVGDLRDVNGDGIMGPGDQVLYRFEVINNGTVALQDVNLDLSSLSLSLPGLSCQPVTLAVGARAFLTCTGNAYTITAADVASGTITLAGDATGMSDAGILVRDHSSAPAVANLGQGGLVVEKLAGVQTAMVGDLVPYTIRITGSPDGVPVTLRLSDTLPAGFHYRAGTSQLDGVAVEPEENGRRLELPAVTVAPGQVRVWTMRVLVGSSVRPGSHTNRVLAVNPVTGAPLAPEATAAVRVLADAVFQCASVLGRVFDDTDQNGDMSKHAEERGLPNVRLVAPNGVAITTDAHGRFNVPCAALPRAIGSNFMLKVDERTLPAGYRMTTENPRVVRLTPGMITRMDFGATMARLVRIDLAANAFAPDAQGRDAMVQELTRGLNALVTEIRGSGSMLLITYVLAPGEAEKLAKQRLRLVEKALRNLWSRHGSYKLNIETLVQRAGAPQ